MVSKPKQVLASGETQATEIAREEAEKLDEHIDENILPEERKIEFRTPGFHRMRTDWGAAEGIVMSQIFEVVDQRVVLAFADAYQIMEDLFEIVRTPEFDQGTGEALRDQYGFMVWKRTPAGGWEEDFGRLSNKQRENFIFMIVTRVFSWEQRAANAWTEAMFAKAVWEERFSIGYDKGMTGTIEDRTATGRLESREERYFAIFVSAFSRKADAVVRSMKLLEQRLKDSLGA